MSTQKVVVSLCLGAAMALAGAAYAAPPSLDGELKVLSKNAPCGVQKVDFKPAPDAPRQIAVCRAIAPESWENRLQQQKIAATCGSLFDVDAQGRPVNVETRCRIASGKPLSEDWRVFHETTLAMLSTAALSYSAYEPAAANSAAKRTNLFVAQDHVFDAGVKSPGIAPFPRSAPKP